jgi:hypothetical protein
MVLPGTLQLAVTCTEQTATNRDLSNKHRTTASLRGKRMEGRVAPSACPADRLSHLVGANHRRPSFLRERPVADHCRRWLSRKFRPHCIRRRSRSCCSFFFFASLSRTSLRRRACIARAGGRRRSLSPGRFRDRLCEEKYHHRPPGDGGREGGRERRARPPDTDRSSAAT